MNLRSITKAGLLLIIGAPPLVRGQGLITSRSFVITNSLETSLGGARMANERIVDRISCAPSGMWASTDVGFCINAAYADLPAAGGKIRVIGSWNYTTPISFSTLNKFAVLEGDPSTGTTLVYTPTSGTALTFNAGRAGLPTGQGLRDIKIMTTTTGGTSAVGMMIGGTNGAVGWYGLNYQISGFTPNVQFGSNIQSVKSDHCTIAEGAQGILYPNTLTQAGEQIGFTDCVFTNTTAWIMDYVRINPAASNNAIMYFMDCHFDNVQYHQSGGDVNLVNTHAENTTNNTPSAYYFVFDGGTASMVDVNAISQQSNAPAGFVSVSGGTSLYVTGINFQNSGLGNIIGFKVDALSALNLGALKVLVGSITYVNAAHGAKLSRLDANAACLGVSPTGPVGLDCLIPNSGFIVSGVNGTFFGGQISGVGNLFAIDITGAAGFNWLGANSYRSAASNPAQSGLIRGVNTDKTCFRNAADSADDCQGEVQHVRNVKGCTTGSMAGNTCATPITVTWPSRFSDTNYTAQCTPGGFAINFPSSPYIAARTRADIKVNYFANTNAAAAWNVIECTAVHD